MTLEEAIAELEGAETNTRFARLVTICENFFGKARNTGTSHHIFKTRWAGDPRINLQPIKGSAKPYQVRQIVKALRKLQTIKSEEQATKEAK